MMAKLTHAELMVAASVGVMRCVAARKNGSKPGRGIQSTGWSEAIEGAAGELAFAKAIDKHWKNMLSDRPNKRPDVAGYEVRMGTGHDYHCPIREDDDDDTKVAFITGNRGDYVVRGWIMARDGKRQEWFRSLAGREPQFYVPQSALTPFGTVGGTA